MTLERSEVALCDTEVRCSGGQPEVVEKRQRERSQHRPAKDCTNKHKRDEIGCCKALFEERNHNNNQLHDASKIQNEARCFHNKKAKCSLQFHIERSVCWHDVLITKPGRVNV